MNPASKPLVITILGPTASGKTATALEIAQHFPSEIISLDSALVYRDMNIGTAKPSPKELASVPHHLIDIIDPSESYSAADFCKDAGNLITKIHSLNKLPILVGGTMMYFRALTTGLAELPRADPVIRARLDEEAIQNGWPALHAKLAALDPETAVRLKPNDSQRIQRALEIISITGQPVSKLLTHQPRAELPFELFIISLEPYDRSDLHERIADRFDAMLENDKLIEEVSQLRKRGDLHLGLPSMRCVGYRQTWQYLDGEFDKSTLREKGIAATRQLAKRQLTWLRAMPQRNVLDCFKPNVGKLALNAIRDEIASDDLYYL